KMIDSEFPGTILLAEANQWPSEAKEYFGNEDEFHMCFNFPLMPRLFIALVKQSSLPIKEIINQTLPIPKTCDWGIFLRNHDELTLEMVTDEERDIMYSEYAKVPKMRLNLGIRRRLAPLVDNDRAKLELLYALVFSIPGSPVLYYGDELGMGDNIYLGDRNGVRTPMQWSYDRNAGFSRADNEALYSPVITNPNFHYESVNVESESRISSSLLNVGTER
ncbi:trehalose synthase, partial [mine drainage metagenome]